MWLEGVRFPDMVRWGDTDGVKDNGKTYLLLTMHFSQKANLSIVSM